MLPKAYECIPVDLIYNSCHLFKQNLGTPYYRGFPDFQYFMPIKFVLVKKCYICVLPDVT